jgi:hypothetical protein
MIEESRSIDRYNAEMIGRKTHRLHVCISALSSCHGSIIREAKKKKKKDISLSLSLQPSLSFSSTDFHPFRRSAHAT